MSNLPAEEEEIPIRETRSNLKLDTHIPPRIDNEFYQADVPNLVGESPNAEDLPIDWFQSTRIVHQRNKLGHNVNGKFLF